MDGVELVAYAGIGRRGNIISDYGKEKKVFGEAIEDALGELPTHTQFLSLGYGATSVRFFFKSGHTFFIVANDAVGKAQSFSLLEQIQEAFMEVQKEQRHGDIYRAVSARFALGERQLDKFMTPRYQEILWFVRGQPKIQLQLTLYPDAPTAYSVKLPESPTDSKESIFAGDEEKKAGKGRSGQAASSGTNVEKRAKANAAARANLMNELADMLEDFEPISKGVDSRRDSLDLGSAVRSNRAEGLANMGSEARQGEERATTGRRSMEGTERFRDFWSRSFTRGEFSKQERLTELDGDGGSLPDEKSLTVTRVMPKGRSVVVDQAGSFAPGAGKGGRPGGVLGRLRSAGPSIFLKGGASVTLQAIDEPLPEPFRVSRGFSKGGAKVDAEDVQEELGAGGTRARGRNLLKLRAGSLASGRLEEGSGGWTYEGFLSLDRILGRRPSMKKRTNSTAK